MKVLIICEFGCAQKNSTGHLVSQVPDLLDGAEVEIIDAETMPQPFRWLYATLQRKKRGASLAKLVALFGLACAGLCRRGRFDHVIVVSNPFLALLLPPFIWRGSRTKLHYLTFDLFPETLNATSLSIPGWLQRFFLRVRNRNLRRANGIFAIGRDMRQHLSAQSIETRTAYAPLWIGATEATVVAERTPLQDGAPDTGVRLNFFGNIGHVQNFGEVLRLLDSNDGFSLDVYGAGAKLETIKAVGHDRVRFFGAIPFQDRATVFSDSGIGIVPQPPELVGLAVPSKAFYYWSRGLPVLFLGEPQSELGQIIARSPELGIVVPPGHEVEDLGARLRDMIANSSRETITAICADLREEARAAFLNALGMR